MKHELTTEQTRLLRDTSVISPNEIAYVMGDLLVIENVVTGQKRTQSHALVETVLGRNNRRLLKD
jgi:hypothetical protein